MVRPGNNLQSGHQPGPRRGGGARSAAERAAAPHRAAAAQRDALEVGKLPPQNNGRSRYRIAGEPREPTP